MIREWMSRFAIASKHLLALIRGKGVQAIRNVWNWSRSNLLMTLAALTVFIAALTLYLAEFHSPTQLTASVGDFWIVEDSIQGSLTLSNRGTTNVLMVAIAPSWGYVVVMRDAARREARDDFPITLAPGQIVHQQIKGPVDITELYRFATPTDSFSFFPGEAVFGPIQFSTGERIENKTSHGHASSEFRGHISLCEFER